MQIISLTTTFFFAFTALVFTVEPAVILSDDFSVNPVHKKTMEVAPGVQRRTTFGKWERVAPGTLRVTNVPEDKHGPVLVYTIPIDNAVLRCDFKLPEAPAENRHFRIFLDHPDYAGHTLNATANISSKFRPPGLSLQHLQKDKKTKKPRVDLEFETVAVDLAPGTWYTMKVTLIDETAKVEIDGKILTEGRSEYLDVTKNKIGLNPGIAGGWIRNFVVTELPTTITGQ